MLWLLIWTGSSWPLLLLQSIIISFVFFVLSTRWLVLLQSVNYFILFQLQWHYKLLDISLICQMSMCSFKFKTQIGCKHLKIPSNFHFFCKAFRNISWYTTVKPLQYGGLPLSEIWNASSCLIPPCYKIELDFISGPRQALLAWKIPFSPQKWLTVSRKLTMPRISSQVNSY